MIVEIVDPSFPDLLGFNFCIKDDLHTGYYVIVETIMKAGTSFLNNYNFDETDFKYNQGKLEIGNPSVLGELYPVDVRELLNNSEGIRKFFTTLFPTYIKDPSSYFSSDINFFSTSTNIEGEETYCIDIKNSEISDVFGFVENTWTPALWLHFEEHELGFSKVVVMVISKKSETPRIVNISLEAYQGDNTPYRRMPKYVLRNDGLVNNWKGFTKKDGYLYSSISGSLVGTEKLEESERPIYNLLKKFAEKEEGWNRSKRYSVGDCVTVGNYVYESVEPDNIGNNPIYSRTWIKHDS